MKIFFSVHSCCATYLRTTTDWLVVLWWNLMWCLAACGLWFVALTMSDAHYEWRGWHFLVKTIKTLDELGEELSDRKPNDGLWVSWKYELLYISLLHLLFHLNVSYSSFFSVDWESYEVWRELEVRRCSPCDVKCNGLRASSPNLKI